MRLLHIGDIVGKPGRQICVDAVRKLRLREKLDLVTANGENAAAGSGITPAIYHELTDGGIDVITLGDHAFSRRDIFGTLRSQTRIVRPANYPKEAPGREFTTFTTRGGVKVGIFVCVGRVFMAPADCPFHAADRVLKNMPDDVQVILMDFHAEATSDKQVMSRHLDGRVAAVIGTHTHIPTADERILPGGTAFQADIGMTGPHESIIGRRIDRVLEKTLTFRPAPFDVATEDVRLNGAIVDIDDSTGRATAIRRLCVTEDDLRRWSEEDG